MVEQDSEKDELLAANYIRLLLINLIIVRFNKSFKLMGKKLLTIALCLFVSIGAAFAQNTVTGTVTDESGQPLAGASVLVAGTTIGVNTDLDGNYSLNVPKDGVLVFSFIGFEEQRITPNGRKNINVVLVEDKNVLNETIVVAFGTTTKEAFTGSASVVKSEELQKRATSNVANALVGTVPGLQMRGASGAPGAGAGSMNIRGISSLYASTSPLIIVDGSPYSASLTNIPQSDIESVTVLKDAASAALYGARGAAGVILVTTKRSGSPDAIINVDMKCGISTRAIQDYDVIKDPGEYYEAYYASLYNRHISEGYDAASSHIWANKNTISQLAYNVFTVPDGELLIGSNGKLNPNATLGRKHVGKDGVTYWVQPDDWQDMAYKSALRQEYNVSVNGSHNKGNYYVSAGYLNDDGIIEYSGFERLTARAKADFQAKKWLKLSTNISYTHSETDSNPNMSASDWGSTNLMYYTSLMAPIYPVYVRILDDAGNVVIRQDERGHDQYDYGVQTTNYSGLQRPFLATGNPLGSNRYNKVQSKGDQLNGTFSGNIRFTEHLSANVSTTITWGSTRNMSYENGFYGPKAGVKGELYKYASTAMRTNNLQTLTYANQFGEHSVNAMIGHEYYNQKAEYLSATAQGGFSPDILEINAFANKLQNSTSYSTRYNVEGYFLSAHYDYAKKYYASASYRRDASSYFHPDHRWGDFWSIGGAWIINKENFMSGTSWIDILKLKVSVGQQGQDNIGNWAYTDLYSLSKANDTQMSPSFYRVGNEKITWETTTNYNLGVEFSFLQGRVNGNLDTYYKKTKDLLFWLSIPESAGSRGYYGNVGDIANYGLEFSVDASVVKTRMVDWRVSLNLAHNTGKILKLPESKIADNGGFYESPFWYAEGGVLKNYMTYSYAGVNEKGQALYYYDADLSTLGGQQTNIINKPGTKKSGTTTVIGEASRYTTGSTLPKLFGGFGTTLTIGNFDLNLTFDYQIGGKIYDSRYANLMTPAGSASDAGKGYHKDWAKSWSSTNTNSNIPHWEFGDEYIAQGSDRWLTDASYLNFQSFSVGYNIPIKKVAHVNKLISRLRVYAVGENLGFISARKGLDPRYSFESTSSMNVYSPVRTISGGIQVTF